MPGRIKHHVVKYGGPPIRPIRPTQLAYGGPIVKPEDIIGGRVVKYGGPPVKPPKMPEEVLGPSKPQDSSPKE